MKHCAIIRNRTRNGPRAAGTGRAVRVLGLLLLALGAGCAEMAPKPEVTAENHLPNPPLRQTVSDAPGLADPIPFVPAPTPVQDTELYTVVVNEVPVRELLFALARDAALNVDISGTISGSVTLNAIDQTLTQILDRLSRQVDLRWELSGDTILVSSDTPFHRTYEVGYVNLSRDVDSEVSVSTRVATTGQTSVTDNMGASNRGNNESRTGLTTRSYNRFWETLNSNLLALLGEVQTPINQNSRVMINAEAGLLTVEATSRQHALVQKYVDNVLANAKRQVLIEATIVEVTLADQYQAGVDWSLVNGRNAGISLNQDQLGSVTDGFINNAISSFVMSYTDLGLGNTAIDATVRLLEEFGNTKVLSSPRLMALNNQTAVLKVVEELVYFNIDVTNINPTTTTASQTFVESEVRSVPVGVVMAVTPQVSTNDEVTLTIRPTISQQVGTVVDPTPQLINDIYGGIRGTQVTNNIPVIRVREMESVLKIGNGQVAVLGGLMQDDVSVGTRSVPGLSKLPLFGDLLFTTDESVTKKTELVIFLRPVVVRDPSLDGDLEYYRRYLEQPEGATAGHLEGGEDLARL